MANCDGVQWPLHVRPFLGEVLCVLLCLYCSQSLNPLKFCCISHTHKYEWLLAQLPPISVLLKQSSLCCSSISPRRKRWALAMISAVSVSWPDLGTTQTSLCVGIPFHSRLETLKAVHFSGTFIPHACGEVSPLAFVPQVPLELLVSPDPLLWSQGAPGWLYSEKELRGRVQAQQVTLPIEGKVNCLSASQILT